MEKIGDLKQRGHTLEAVEYMDECIEEIGTRSSANNDDLKVSATILTIMPNPTNDLAKVLLSEDHDIPSLLLLDAYGRTVQVFDIEPKQTMMNLNTSGLNTGVYYLSPSNREGIPVRFAVLH